MTAVLVLAGVAVIVVAVRWPSAVLTVLRVAGNAVLAPVAAGVERRRNRRPVAAGTTQETETLRPRMSVWHATLLVLDGRGTARTLAAGLVPPGTGHTRAAVEAAVMRRWVAAHGWPQGGRLACRAEPRTGGTR